MAKYKALVDITVDGKEFKEGSTITSKLSKGCEEFFLSNNLIEEVSATPAPEGTPKESAKSK